MEENIVQYQPIEIQNQPERPRLKIVLFSALGVGLVGGLVFAGYWWGINSKLKAQNAKLQLKTQNLTPTEAPVATSVPTFLPETTPFSDGTADWKTYTNPTKTISFQHPDWNIDTSLPRTSNRLDLEFKSPDGTYIFTYSAILNFKILEGKYTSLEDLLDNFSYYQGEYKEVAEYEKIMLDGQEALKTPAISAQVQTGATYKSAYVFSKDQEYIFKLTITINSTTDEVKIMNGFRIFDQILSTFRFLE